MAAYASQSVVDATASVPFGGICVVTPCRVIWGFDAMAAGPRRRAVAWLDRSAMKTLWLIWDVLAGRQQRKAVALLLLMVVGMLLETLGVGLIIPALALIDRKSVV